MSLRMDSFRLAFALVAMASAASASAVDAEVRQLRAVKRGHKVVGRETVPLKPLVGGGWRFTWPAERITTGPAAPTAIEVAVPDFFRARCGEKGFWLSSGGCYGAFTETNGVCKTRPRSMLLPVVGFSSPRGCWMAVVRGLAFEANEWLSVTNGVYELTLRFQTSEIGPKVYEDAVIDFLPLKGKDATYAGIARRYRAERLAKGEVKPLAERIKTSPTLAYTADSIFVRVKHGWKAHPRRGKDKTAVDPAREHQSPTNEPPIQCAISFERFADIMRRMKAAGIDKAEICSVGGTAGGFDGRWPDILPIPEEFGGERKLRDAIALGQSLGYQVVTHFATTAMLECSRQWNADDICLKPDGQPLLASIVAGGRTHRLCPKVYAEKFLENDWRMFREFGYRGTHHVDVISIIDPYPCCNPKHPLTRAESAKWLRLVGDRSREVFGGFGSEGGRDWMVPSLDFALYLSVYPAPVSGTKLAARLVPFWQLVYHGITISNPLYSTIDAYVTTRSDKEEPRRRGPFEGSWDRVLKLHEFGGRPVFYFYNYHDIAPLVRAAEDYAKYAHLQTCFMDDHRELAKGVFLTRYSNGEETVANYTDAAFPWRGRAVSPRAIELFRKTKGKTK